MYAYQRWRILAAGLALCFGTGLALVLVSSLTSNRVAVTTIPGEVPAVPANHPAPTVAPPAAVAIPTLLPGAPEPQGQPAQVRVSHYKPWLGGVNCFKFVGGQCVSNMASGLPWQDWINRAAACPKEWPFGTLIVLEGNETFVCLDRGGKIVVGSDGIAWIDLLLAGSPPVRYGEVIPVTLYFP